MPKRGPSKTPAAVLKERGTFRKDRHHDAAIDSDLKPKLPSPPEHFDEVMQSLWYDLGQKLADRGLMTELDAQAFELLVGSYFAMRQSQEQLANEELVMFVGENGTPMANPLVGIQAKYLATLKWCLTQFGCTPSARTGVKTEKKALGIDPMAALLGRISTPTPADSKPKSPRKKK